MNNNTERAAFEDFVKRRAFNPGYDLSKATWPDGKESYCCEYVCLMWEAWQAARNAPAAPVPQGWRDVAELCAQMCDSRARSLLGDKHLTAGTEAKKCASVLRDPPDYWCEKLNAAAAPQPPEGAL